MRLDDWQRWLEDQFLDTNPNGEEAAEESAADEALRDRHGRAGVAVLDRAESADPERTPPASETGRTADVPRLAPAHGSRADAPRAQPLREQVGGKMPTGVDLPRIENYLPFLRVRDQPQAEGQEPVVEVRRPEGGEKEPEIVEQVEPAPKPEPLEARLDTAAEPPDLPADHASYEAPAPGVTVEEQPPVQPDRRETGVAHPPRKRRGRNARNVPPPELAPPLTSEQFWQLAPRHIRTLIGMGHDGGVQRSYRRQFKESRLALIERLLDPTLSLEDTARLLNVCPTTVRRYTNRGQLRHQRTPGDQRRFRLSDVLAFMEAQEPEDLDGRLDRRARHEADSRAAWGPESRADT